MNKYRADIEGLRAIAVLVVVFFHYQVPCFKGGFVGVDIFFVISGYLISSIIMKDLTNNTFSFVAFYERRIRRIFPALFAMLFVSTIVALILYDYGTLREFGKTLIATVVFASNFYFYKHAGYFTTFQEQSVLLHTWSLAVEEQFYLVFPIVIYFLHKHQASRIKYYIVTGFLLSLGLCIIEDGHTRFAFYLLPTRAWEFLIGTLLALRLFSLSVNPKINLLLSIAGFGLIIGAVLCFSSTQIYPSYNALFPVLGVSLVIYSGEYYPQTLVNNFLGLSFFRFFSKISYSLYLWHWGLYVFYQYVSFSSLNGLDIVLLLVASFLLSFLSWRFVEQPFRHVQNKQVINNKYVFKLSFLVVCLLLSGGFTIYKTNGLPLRYSENNLIIDTQKDSITTSLVKWEDFDRSHPNSQYAPPILGNKSKIPNSILWGDSHARCLASGLFFNVKHASFYIATQSSVIALQNINTFGSGGSSYSISENSKKVLRFIRNEPKIKTIFLAGFWANYINDIVLEDITSDVINSRNLQENNLFLFEKGLRETLITINSDTVKRKIILITDVPNLIFSPASYLAKKRFHQPEQNLNEMTPKRSFYESNNKEILALFKQIKKEGLIDDIFPLHEQFFEGNKTIVQEKNHILYEDSNHLSRYGSIKVKGFEKYLENYE